MAQRDILVIGASTGGTAALRHLFARLPADLPAALFAVLHRSPNSASALERILKDGMELTRAREKGPIKRGTIVLAPPDRHLQLEKDGYRTSFGPRENFSRPSVNVLFRSAARAFGPRVIGVVLSGGLSDGAEGIAEIKAHGGITIVQDPDEAQDPSMPLNALRTRAVDYRLPLDGIAERLGVLTRAKLPRAARTRVAKAGGRKPKSQPMTLNCPECGGALAEESSRDCVAYCCHEGHRFTPEKVLEGQRDELEVALWSAIRSLTERAAVERRLAATTRVTALLRKAEENERHAATLRSMLERLVT